MAYRSERTNQWYKLAKDRLLMLPYSLIDLENICEEFHIGGSFVISACKVIPTSTCEVAHKGYCYTWANV